MTRIKLCGFTRTSDAQAASDLGVDAIGLIFWPSSPRCVPLAVAERIAAAMPPFVTVVGVFVNQPLREILQTVDAVGLGAVQLHGDEPETMWTRLPVPVIKATAVDATFEPGRLASWPSRVVPLLDAASADRRGGTGQRVDWALARRAAGVRPIVLSGGLTPETVQEAIAQVGPAAVDAASGVEEAPGVKHAARMAAFVAAVRRADGR